MRTQTVNNDQAVNEIKGIATETSVATTTTKSTGHRQQHKNVSDQPDKQVKPVLVDKNEAKRLYGFSPSLLYRETKVGNFSSIKIRGRTFWLVQSIEERIAAAARPDLKYLTPTN